jgi:hypothetical protein
MVKRAMETILVRAMRSAPDIAIRRCEPSAREVGALVKERPQGRHIRAVEVTESGCSAEAHWE